MGKSISDILSGGNSAEKYRDHLGETLTITGYTTVNTKDGESVQFTAQDDGGEVKNYWAPSIVAKQVKELDENGFLPARLTLSTEESQNGREYFTLVQPDDA
jgi:hypothetical protein